MNRFIKLVVSSLMSLVFCVVAVGNEPLNATKNKTTKSAAPAVKIPHCEVPCGIYADQMRFEQMLEDTATIAKAIDQINEFASSVENGPSAKGINQVMRSANTKETHATNTQHIVAQYFLTQRIKPTNKDYMGQLATAHRVMVAAMKCKQDANPATAEALKKAILELYKAYEGKEPSFHQSK